MYCNFRIKMLCQLLNCIIKYGRNAIGLTIQYIYTLETKLIEIQKLSCSRETDEITAHDAIDAYMDKLNCAIRDSAVEAGCNSKQHVKPKRYWCPDLSKLRDRKRFWW